MAVFLPLFSYNQPIVSAFIKKPQSVFLSSLVGALALTLASCAYRMPPATPPSQELVRIVAKAPERYTLQVKTWTVNNYEVSHDGRVTVGVPSYRRACGVYLFDVVKVGGYADPLKMWSLSISRNGQIIRTLSLQAIRTLATDEAGYHMLRLRD